MKRYLNFFLGLLVLFGFVSEAGAQKAKHYKQLEYPPLREPVVPEPARYELPNGMILFLLEDHELPIIELSAIVRTGSRWEPAEKIGLASITGQVMRTGGTTTRTGDEIDDELEAIAASVETFIGRNSGGARVSMMREDVDDVLNFFADALMNPAFREDKIDLAKIQQRDGIARRNDNVLAITSREFTKLIYGGTSPYARHTEYETIENITRDDLVAFQKQFYAPNNVMLGIWGDFDTDEMKKKIELAFKDWQRSEVYVPPVPEVTYEFGQRIYFIQKDDVNQTNVRVGHLGGRIDDSDYFALDLASEILGSGFVGRMFKNIRSAQGLAYSVFASWGTNYDYPGIFQGGGQTKSESSIRFIRAILKEIQDMTESEVTDDELRVAKEGILNSFVFNFDTKGEIVNRILRYEYFGYPKDFLQQYKRNIEKVSKADILRVAKKYFKPDQMVILAVGRAEDFDEPLSTLGTVETIDITIPEPEEVLPEPTEETVARGREILADAAEATGGGRLKALKDITRVGEMSMVTPQGEFAVALESVLKLPLKFRQTMKMPFGEMTMVFDGETAWMITAQGIQDAPESQKKEIQSSVAREPLYILMNYDQPRYTVQFVKEETVDGAKAHVVLVHDSETDQAVRLFCDSKTNHVVKSSYTAPWMGTPAKLEEFYSDHQTVNGITIPFKTLINKDGQKAAETVWTEVKVNAGVMDALFTRE
ncbi:MAG: insulinase family protein [Bacteroidota bacterium]